MKKILLTLILSMCIGSTAVIGAEENSAPEAAENTAIIQKIEASATPIVTSEPTAAPQLASTPIVTLQPYKDPPPYDKSFLHETHDGFYMLYSVASDGSAVFEGVDAELSKDYPSKLVIPEKLGGHTVKTVKRVLPYEPGWPQIHRTDVWKTITDIELPETVEVIADYAFNYLSKLQKVNLPKNIKEIGDYIEDYSKCGDELNIPPNVKRIGPAFGSSKYSKVTLPEGLEEIGTTAFGNTEFKEITLPHSLKTIGKGAFSASALTEIYIPDSVTYIGENAFDGIALKKARIPSAFKNYEGLGKIFNSYTIENIVFDGEITDNIKNEFFYSTFMKNYFREQEHKDFVVENNVLRLYCGDEKNVLVPEGIKEIDREAFINSDIINISFPSTLISIGTNAFAGSKLQQLYFPASVLTIGSVAFYNCKDLERVEFEDKGQRVIIGDSAFDMCNDLNVIILPKNYNASSVGTSDAFWTAVENGKTAPRSTAKPVDTKNEEKVTTAPATTPQPEKAGKFVVTNENGEIGISLNGEAIPFRTDKPFIDESDRTQTPLRAVMEYFGCNVSYDDKTRTVEASKLGTVVTLTIDSPDMTVNGETVKMDTAARIVNDRTYIPIRFVAEALGFDVVWK